MGTCFHSITENKHSELEGRSVRGQEREEEGRLSYSSCAPDEGHEVPTHRQQDDDGIEVDW